MRAVGEYGACVLVRFRLHYLQEAEVVAPCGGPAA